MRSHVLTMGTFDLFHAGHVGFLQACRSIGCVTVAVNTSDYAGAFKPDPICTTVERAAVVRACAAVDNVVINKGDCCKIIKQWAKYRPAELKFLVIGEDWMPGQHYLQQLGISDADWLAEQDVKLLFIAEQSHLHTSEIKERCQKRQSP